MQRLHPTLNILVATHKAITPPPYPELTVIQVGTGDAIADHLRENQLDNIAAKNPYFCELTILYFIWKNIHSPLVGLVHSPIFTAKMATITIKMRHHPPIRSTAFSHGNTQRNTAPIGTPRFTRART